MSSMSQLADLLRTKSAECKGGGLYAYLSRYNGGEWQLVAVCRSDAYLTDTQPDSLFGHPHEGEEMSAVPLPFIGDERELAEEIETGMLGEPDVRLVLHQSRRILLQCLYWEMEISIDGERRIVVIRSEAEGADTFILYEIGDMAGNKIEVEVELRTQIEDFCAMKFRKLVEWVNKEAANAI